MKKRTTYLKLIPILLWGFIACSKVQDTAKHPNIIIVMTDDQGWGDIQSHGNPQIDTPIMDRLADEGARFDRFFVSPVCAPTRASLLTGRDHLRTGTQWVTYGLENMRADEETFAEVFKKAGYETGLFGKWHNGSHYPMDPIGQGFDTFFGFKMGHFNNYFDSELEYNGKPVKTEGFITDVLTDSALAFIERNKEQPFLAYVPYNAPHSPFQVPETYFQKYKERGLSDKNATVYGMVENVDENLGRILDKLDELNIAEETIVIFLTDNGPNGGDRFNGNMKGWKAKVDEGGVRVPFFIRWPGKIKTGTSIKELTAHIDVLPTLVELAGIQYEEINPLDGKSFAPLLFEEQSDWPNRYLFTHQSRWDSLEQYPSSVRDKSYRLVNYNDDWELYDMENDSSQLTNIAEQNTDIVAEMSQAYDDWFIEITKEFKGRMPIPVGYNASPSTSLPATESYFSGNIAFKGKSGWSNDWLANWTSTSDKIWWDLDVIEEGNYIVEALYSLEEENVGTAITASSDEDEIKYTFSSSYIAVQIPSPDRVERGEVYEQKWGRVPLGLLQLEKGNQQLKLRANLIPGNSSIDLKRIILTKIK